MPHSASQCLIALDWSQTDSLHLHLPDCPQEEFTAKFERLVAEHVQKGKLAPELQAATIEANVAKRMDREMLGRELATVQRKLQEMEAEAGGSRAELEAEVSCGLCWAGLGWAVTCCKGSLAKSRLLHLCYLDTKHAAASGTG